jgi:hypothetical protein
MGERVYGPWTENELYKIKLVQENANFNPHVCPAHTNRALIVTSHFLFCIECGYQQKWVSDRICGQRRKNDKEI